MKKPLYPREIRVAFTRAMELGKMEAVHEFARWRAKQRRLKRQELDRPNRERPIDDFGWWENAAKWHARCRHTCLQHPSTAVAKYWQEG